MPDTEQIFLVRVIHVRPIPKPGKEEAFYTITASSWEAAIDKVEWIYRERIMPDRIRQYPLENGSVRVAYRSFRSDKTKVIFDITEAK